MNIFEHSNARYFNSNQLAKEFIWTSSFDKLLSNKNNIILGSRGSGKTALIKMLSHEYLSKSDDPRAKQIIKDQTFIATYVPLKVEWVSSVNTLDTEDNQYFNWSINISSCARFVDTIRSCLSNIIHDEVERLIKEREISISVSNFWFSKTFKSLSDIVDELENIEYEKNIVFNKLNLGIETSDDDKMVGINFNTSLFQPMRKAISVVKKVLDINPDSVWCLCIDEAEFLSLEQHKILNTYMRSYNDLVFKITTMPYRHYTLETLVGTPLNIGHDFDYLYIDRLGMGELSQQTSRKLFNEFAINLFNKRVETAKVLNEKTSLETLLGPSPLLDNLKEENSDEDVYNQILEFCDDKTISRANKLKEENNTDLYQSSIIRKLRGSLILRREVLNYKGNMSPSVYSGCTLITRCSDGNPRRLLRIFNFLFSGDLVSVESFEKLSAKEQGRSMKQFSYSELENLNLEKNGTQAFDLFSLIGKFLKDKFHTDKISTNTFNSFHFDCNENDEIWEHIKNAVDLGLIYPDFKGIEDENKMPIRKGNFSLAFCLAPWFFLMPRKGNSISLTSIMESGTYHNCLRHKNKSLQAISQLELKLERENANE